MQGKLLLRDKRKDVDNVDKLVEDAKHYKERMLKMKDTLVKERGEGRELKRKHEVTLSEKQNLQREYQTLELEKDALEVQVIIMEGEEKDFEDKSLELESQKYVANKQAGELIT